MKKPTKKIPKADERVSVQVKIPPALRDKWEAAATKRGYGQVQDLIKALMDAECRSLNIT